MVAVQFDGAQLSPRALRLSRPGLLGWYRRRRYRFALRNAPLAPGARVFDVGGGLGIFAGMLLRAGAGEVTVVEPNRRSCREGSQLCRDPRLRFVHDDVFARLELLRGADVVSALHSLHQLGPEVHALFRAIEASSVRVVVLQGSTSHRVWVEPEHHRELWGPVLGVPDGMVRLLERYGFRARLHPHRRYPVTVGVR